MGKKKRKFRGRRPKPRDPYWKKFWNYLTPKNKENFYRQYYEDKKKGVPTTSWEMEYPIFLWCEELKEELLKDVGENA